MTTSPHPDDDLVMWEVVVPVAGCAWANINVFTLPWRYVCVSFGEKRNFDFEAHDRIPDTYIMNFSSSASLYQCLGPISFPRVTAL